MKQGKDDLQVIIKAKNLCVHTIKVTSNKALNFLVFILILTMARCFAVSGMKTSTMHTENTKLH